MWHVVRGTWHMARGTWHVARGTLQAPPVRLLIVHEAPAGGGGVESYLASIIPGFAARGHDVAFLHYNSAAEQGPTRLDGFAVPSASIADRGLAAALEWVTAWRPDVCFSHNMR